MHFVATGEQQPDHGGGVQQGEGEGLTCRGQVHNQGGRAAGTGQAPARTQVRHLSRSARSGLHLQTPKLAPGACVRLAPKMDTSCIRNGGMCCISWAVLLLVHGHPRQSLTPNVAALEPHPLLVKLQLQGCIEGAMRVLSYSCARMGLSARFALQLPVQPSDYCCLCCVACMRLLVVACKGDLVTAVAGASHLVLLLTLFHCPAASSMTQLWSRRCC